MADPDAVIQKANEEKRKRRNGVQDLTKTREGLTALESLSSRGLSQASTSEVNDVILDPRFIEGGEDRGKQLEK